MAEESREMSWTRRNLLKSLSRTALVLPFADVLALAAPQEVPQQTPATGMNRQTYNTPARPAPKTLPSPVTGTALGYRYVDQAHAAGLLSKTIYGNEHKNRYLLETTGCGVAFFDYDGDDWVDIFLVNGSRLDGFPGLPKDQVPLSRLFKNNRDGWRRPRRLGPGLLRGRLRQRWP